MNARTLSNRIEPSTPPSHGMPLTMAAIVQRPYGSTKVPQLTAVAETPAPADHAVLVEVHAAAVVPAVTRRYGLRDVPDAIDDLVAGRIAGKAVIIVDGAEADAS